MKRFLSLLFLLCLACPVAAASLDSLLGNALNGVSGSDAALSFSNASDEATTAAPEQGSPSFGAPSGKETWAIYWYLCGSDLETDHGAASADLEELLRARLPDNVTVVIQTGGARRWHGRGVSSRHIGRYVYHGGKLRKVDKQPQANMGNGKTLASFLKFCKTHYSAEHQVFVFWNHGGGSIGGVSNDENYDMDSLSLKEVRQAFEKVYTASPDRPPFEIIGFDTCLMATVDTANAVHGFARYMVASQELEPGNGWLYSKWPELLGKNTSMNGAELGRIICDSYMEGCRMEGTEGNATLSLVDLAQLPEVIMTYNALGFEAVALDDENFYAQLGRAAKSSENYMNSRSEGYTNMVDMGSLARKLRHTLPEFSQLFLDALQKAVLYQVSGPYRKPSGLSCYYPFDGDRDSFRSMMQTENITSFLILSGLQHGFIDGDTAVQHLERLYKEISAAVEEADSSESSAQAPAPLPDSVPAPAPAPAQQEQSAPGSPVYDSMADFLNSSPAPEESPQAPSGAGSAHPASVISLLGGAVSNTITSVKPLDTLDISTLEDFRVTISDAGEAQLTLGPDRVRHLSSVQFYLAYVDVEEDIIILLGTDSDLQADWDAGIFKDNFQGTWASLDGRLVYKELTSEDERYNHYAVPIKLNGVRCNLVVVYDFETQAYKILGARRLLDNNVADKTLIKLKQGDKIVTIHKGMTISGDDEEFQDVEIDTFTLADKAVFEDTDLGDGTFMLMFEMTDVQNNSATSQLVSITVKGDEAEYEVLED